MPIQAIIQLPLHFNPRSHEGSDAFLHQPIPESSRISTRAPTRGATHCRRCHVCYVQISTRAPTRGATNMHFILWIIFCYFNPRSHEGSDVGNAVSMAVSTISTRAPTRGATYLSTDDRDIMDISTRAPTRGATAICCTKHKSIADFNPRSHEGSDWNRPIP